MVDLFVSGGVLVLHVRGADKLWALKIRLSHDARPWCRPRGTSSPGQRLPTNIP